MNNKIYFYRLVAIHQCIVKLTSEFSNVLSTPLRNLLYYLHLENAEQKGDVRMALADKKKHSSMPPSKLALTSLDVTFVSNITKILRMSYPELGLPFYTHSRVFIICIITYGELLEG